MDKSLRPPAILIEDDSLCCDARAALPRCLCDLDERAHVPEDAITAAMRMNAPRRRGRDTGAPPPPRLWVVEHTGARDGTRDA